ncbi:MAG: hypothetical protein ACYC9K_01125 [Sulfuricaulis sp.]
MKDAEELQEEMLRAQEQISLQKNWIVVLVALLVVALIARLFF